MTESVFDDWGDGEVDLGFIRDNVPQMGEVALQRPLFTDTPTKEWLLGYEPMADRGLPRRRVLVCGNAPFGDMEALLPAYLDYAGLAVDFTVAPPDPAMRFGAAGDAGYDAILVWVDMAGHVDKAAWDFVSGRMAALARMTDKPALLAGKGVGRIPRIRGGVGFTGKAGPGEDEDVALAAALGCSSLPALFGKRIKAVMVDLDGTLYYSLPPSEGHLALQRRLADLAKRGVALCLVSWNYSEDVEWAFEPDSGFALGRGDFSVISASWEDKEETIARLAGDLRLRPDEVAFIDDRMAHLDKARKALPGIRAIFAERDGWATLRAVDHCPGLAWCGYPEGEPKDGDGAVGLPEKKAGKGRD